VCKCVLPSGDNPIEVNKYIVYLIIYYILYVIYYISCIIYHISYIILLLKRHDFFFLFAECKEYTTTRLKSCCRKNHLFQGIVSVLSEAPFFLKLGLNILIRRLDSQPVHKMSVYDYIWKNSDPILKLASKVVPSMVPMDNVGVLDMVSLIDGFT
jgi:hypothetical protein